MFTKHNILDSFWNTISLVYCKKYLRYLMENENCPSEKVIVSCVNLYERNYLMNRDLSCDVSYDTTHCL